MAGRRRACAPAERRGPALPYPTPHHPTHTHALSHGRGHRAPPAAAPPSSSRTAATKSCRLLPSPSRKSDPRGRGPPAAAWLPAGRGAHPSTRVAGKGFVKRSPGSGSPSSGIGTRCSPAPGRRSRSSGALLQQLLQQMCAYRLVARTAAQRLVKVCPTKLPAGFMYHQKSAAKGCGWTVLTDAQRCASAE